MKYTKEFWDTQPLGQMADYKIAGKVGVAESTVSRQRKLRGLLAFGRKGNRRRPEPIPITKNDARIIKQNYTNLVDMISSLENKIKVLMYKFYSTLPAYADDSDIAEIIGCCEATVFKYRSMANPIIKEISYINK
jgi:hypothetical protein